MHNYSLQEEQCLDVKLYLGYHFEKYTDLFSFMNIHIGVVKYFHHINIKTNKGSSYQDG